MQSPTYPSIDPPVIAYPIDEEKFQSTMENNVYDSTIGDASFASDSVEMSGNFFSQLDSMIQAVKLESNALDSMKEKLKEVESLRNQISTFTKRLLDADQANLTLKTNIVKLQDSCAELKNQKAEIESSVIPMRQELNRTKELYNKEKMMRTSAQQEINMLKDQITNLEHINKNLDQENRSIPALRESHEFIKNDLQQLRKRYKEEKNSWNERIKFLEAKTQDSEAIKGIVRDLSLKLLDVSSNTSQSPLKGYHHQQQYYNANNSTHSQKSSIGTQRLEQPSHLSSISQSYVHYEEGFENNSQPRFGESAMEEEDDEEKGDYFETNSYGDSDGDNSYFDDDSVQSSIASTIQSSNSYSSPQNQYIKQSSQPKKLSKNSNYTSGNSSNRSGHEKKKRVSRRTQGQGGTNRGQQQGTVHVMQTLSSNPQQQYVQSQQQQGGGTGLQQSFSLPRI